MDVTEAFVVSGPRQGRVQLWPLSGGEVTVEVEACALCQRDIGIWTGEIPRRFPDVLGHEVVGRVVECTPGARWPVGTLVAGMGNQGLARHMRVPDWQLAPVADAGFHLALVEPLACAINACEQDESPPGSTAVVFGLGLLGQLVAALLVTEGRRVVGVDSDPARLELAAGAGVDPIEPGAPCLARAVRDAGAAYECTADEHVLWQLSTELAPGAALLLVAHHRSGGRRAAEFLDQWHRRGLRVRNTVPRTSADMASCIRRAAGMPVDLARYPIRMASLDEAGRLLDEWPRGSVLRNVIVMA